MRTKDLSRRFMFNLHGSDGHTLTQHGEQLPDQTGNSSTGPGFPSIMSPLRPARVSPPGVSGVHRTDRGREGFGRAGSHLFGGRAPWASRAGSVVEPSRTP